MSTELPRRKWRRPTAILCVVCVGVLSVPVISRFVAHSRAKAEYERVYAAWESGLATPADVCRASQAWCKAQVAIPFSDCKVTTVAHLDRVDKLRYRVYGPLSEYRMGASTEVEVAAAEASKAEIDRFYDDAEQLVATNCETIWVGVVRSKIFEDVYNELQTHGIEDRGDGNLGWDAIVVPVKDLQAARSVLLTIRGQREGVDWIRGVDPPWVDHLKSFGQARQSSGNASDLQQDGESD